MRLTGAQFKDMFWLWVGDEIHLTINDEIHIFHNDDDYFAYIKENVKDDAKCTLAMAIYEKNLMIAIRF